MCGNKFSWDATLPEELASEWKSLVNDLYGSPPVCIPRSYSTGRDGAVGDIVVVHEENLPRWLWRLGKVERLIPGRDGRIRGATVRLSSEGRQHSLLRRAVQLLYPLEVHSSASPADEGSGGGPVSEVPEPTDLGEGHSQTIPTANAAARRPQRTASLQAKDRLKALAVSEVSEEF